MAPEIGDLRIGQIGLEHADVSPPPMSLVQPRNVFGLGVDHQQAFAVEERMAQVPDTRPGLQHPLPQEAAALLDHPVVVAIRVRHGFQDVHPRMAGETGIEESAPQHFADGLEPVDRADLLPFPRGPPRIADGNLVNPCPPLRQAGGQFRLEIKRIALQLQLLQHIGTDHFEAGLHVRQVHIVEHVRGYREHGIDQTMPEVQHAAGCADETRSEHGVGLAFQDWLEQLLIPARVVFQVGVLDDRHVALHLFDRRADRRPLPPIGIVAKGLDSRLAAGKFLHQLPRPVRRAVIDDDDFDVEADRRFQDAFQNLLQSPALVVDRDEHR